MSPAAIQLFHVTPGVQWLEIPSANLRVLCGCPAEVVKHLARRGFIRSEQRGGRSLETGPNAILLSDLPIQNGTLANLAEFPVLQMLYRQGMLLPGHPNNTGAKPLLLGSTAKLRHQLDYIHRGNYGLLSLEEIIAAGIEPELAQEMMAVKLAFAFGEIRPPEAYIDTLAIGHEPVVVRDGLVVRRVALNRFEFSLDGEQVEVDLNLPEGTSYQLPYVLQHHEVSRAYFSVIHTGEGDGWDVNRPSMSSVLMFQGRCFLVDAPPNIEQILAHLGIDLSEVEGLFHTHAHDDHFAGITALMRAGHRIKYFATPLVRLSVSRKLAALTGLGEAHFAQFFAIHDLLFDRWNDCEGLEVKPLYSPHPVDNNLFLFRALGADGYRSYAHWADLTSLPVLERMVLGEGGGPAISRPFLEQIKAHYRTPADIKKLDIGGGLIHGRAEDFASDASGRLVLAHISRPLTDAEREIGSSATFGAEDLLIPGEQDYRRQRAHRQLRAYFPNAPEYRLQSLLIAPLVEVNAGAIILRRGQQPEHLHLLLTGALEYIQSEAGIRHVQATGALAGEAALFDPAPAQGSWRALCHTVMLRIPLELMRSFLQGEGLLERMQEQVQQIGLLRHSRLLGERISHVALKRIADHSERLLLPADSLLASPPPGTLYLVCRGELELRLAGALLERIGAGDFFGEEGYFDESDGGVEARTLGEVELIRITGYPLGEHPVVLWKLLEARSRRRNLVSALVAVRGSPENGVTA